MMHLVLEQVQEQPVHPLLLDMGAAMHGNDALQSSFVKFCASLSVETVPQGS